MVAVLFGAIGCIARGAAAQTAPALAPAPAYKDGATLTFSNLILRLDGQDEIGLAKADFRVLILEQLRADGFKAMGAENLVFGIDKSKDRCAGVGPPSVASDWPRCWSAVPSSIRIRAPAASTTRCAW